MERDRERPYYEQADQADKKSIAEMEEVREIAVAHYQAGSQHVQKLAWEFYQSMDSDGNGRVDQSEFLAFMAHQGYSHMQNLNFFGKLDRDGNGTLEFFEVMTLYYIIKSGRPFCNRCAKFIPGIFFSCVECFKKNPKTSFYLCRDCHRQQRFDHNHDGRAQFLDNYTLLQAVVDPPRGNSSRSIFNQNIPIVPPMYNLVHPHYAMVPPSVHPHYAMVPQSPDQNWVQYRPTNDMGYVHNSYDMGYVHNPSTTNNTCVVHPHNNAMIPASSNEHWRKWEVALFAFETALSIGAIASTGCSIM